MAPPPARTAPYKDFLQPALQRRFASTAFLLLAVSYVQALCFASWNSAFWSLFPIGPTGIRTLMIFVSGLLILVLRIAQYHVGVRMAHSPIKEAISQVLSVRMAETLAWYLLSCSLFGLLFMVSVPEGAGLHVVTYNASRRAYLNERPIFFACHVIGAGIFQALQHRLCDWNHLDLGRLLPRAHANGSGPAESPSPLVRAVRRFPQVFISSMSISGVIAMATCPLYVGLLRGTARYWFLLFLRPFFNLPKTNVIPSQWPFDVALIARCTWAGCHLLFLWSTANEAFTIFMNREPLKNGNPLTADSKDPNGSLLNGLRSKKLSIQAFAMWELRYIVDECAERRKTIFTDIDRRDGAMWSQVLGICMGIIQGIEGRVDGFLHPSTPEPAQPREHARTRVVGPVKELPAQPPATFKDEVKKEVGSAISSVALSPGVTPASLLAPHFARGANKLEHKVFGDRGVSVLADWLHGILFRVLQMRCVKTLYRQRFTQRYTGLVLGSPYAEKTLYINAAHVLGQLAARSLAEDDYGNVHRDVPAIVRTLTAVINKVKILKDEFPPHWTEAVALGSDPVSRNTPEVDAVLAEMRASLKQVVEKFFPYRANLRLSALDVRLAQEACAEPATAREPQQAEAPAPKKKRSQERASERVLERGKRKPGERVPDREDGMPEENVSESERRKPEESVLGEEKRKPEESVLEREKRKPGERVPAAKGVQRVGESHPAGKPRGQQEVITDRPLRIEERARGTHVKGREWMEWNVPAADRPAMEMPEMGRDERENWDAWMKMTGGTGVVHW